MNLRRVSTFLNGRFTIGSSVGTQEHQWAEPRAGSRATSKAQQEIFMNRYNSFLILK